MSSVRAVLSRRNFQRFLAARLISNFGNGMGTIALAFGILHMRGGSATELGIVVGSTSLAYLFVSPFGGVIADRYGRIRMAAITDTWGGIVLLVQAIWFTTGHVPFWFLLFAQINFGVMWAIFWPALAGIVPALIDDEDHLMTGNALTQMTSNLMLILGSSIGGWIIATKGSSTALIIDSVTFIISGLMVLTLRHLTIAPEPNENTMIDDLLHGWKVFLSFRWIVIVVFGFSSVFMCWSAIDSVLGPLLAIKKFHGASSWATIVAVEFFGYLAGSLIAIKVRPKYPMRFLLLGTYAICGYLIALAFSNSVWIIAVFAFFFGINFDLWGAIWSTSLQREVPKESLSRVSAFDGMGTLLTRPIGVAVAAPLAGAIGLQSTFLWMAALCAIVITAMLAFPAVWKMQLTDSIDS
ncbi:MAG: MFS transporter [Actinomycetes bacterium]